MQPDFPKYRPSSTPQPERRAVDLSDASAPLTFDRISVTRLQNVSSDGGYRVMTIRAELGAASVSIQCRLEQGKPCAIVSLESNGSSDLPPVASRAVIGDAVEKYLKERFGSADSGAIIQRIDASWPIQD